MVQEKYGVQLTSEERERLRQLIGGANGGQLR